MKVRRFQRWAAPCGCTAERTVYRYEGGTWQMSDAFVRECDAHHDPEEWAWSYTTPNIPDDFHLIEDRAL